MKKLIQVLVVSLIVGLLVTTLVSSIIIPRDDWDFKGLFNIFNVTNQTINGNLTIRSIINCTGSLQTNINGTIFCGTASAIATNPFNQNLNTTSNVSFGNVTSSGWFNGLFNWTINTVSSIYLQFNGNEVTFNEAQLNATIDNRVIANESNRFQNLTTYSCSGTDKVTGVHPNGTVICGTDSGGTDTNETNRFQNLTTYSCQGTQKVTGVQTNGTVVCATDQTIPDTNETVRMQNLTTYACQGTEKVVSVANNGTVVCAEDSTTASNPFDQELNTTEDVTFNNVAVTNNLTVLNRTRLVHLTTEHQHTPQNDLEFNWYDDGSEIFLNSTEAEAFNIETDSSMISLIDVPSAGNNWKIFQILNKVSQTTSEFVITQAGPELTSYIIRSFSLTGNGSIITSPHNCSTYAQYIDCQTDITGPDLFVLDDIELNGTIYVQEEVRANNWTNVTITESQISDLAHTGSTNIFDQDLNTTNNVQFANITSTGNLTVSGINVCLQNGTNCEAHTTDTNETNRLQNLTTYNCQGTEKVTGIQLNGTVICGTDVDTGGVNTWEANLTSGVSDNLNPFDDITQTLGTLAKRWIRVFANEGFFGNVNTTEVNATTIRIAGVDVVAGAHTGNETVRLQNLTTYACQGTDRVISIALNGTVVCGATGSAATSWTFASNLIYNATLTTRVGIGIATPSYSLEVNGNSSLNKTLFVNTNGLVGIGTAAPSSKLTVAGTLGVTNDVTITTGKVSISDTGPDLLTLTSTGAIDSEIRMFAPAGERLEILMTETGEGAGTQGRIIYAVDTDAFSIFTAGTQAIGIDSSQNVGIGTAIPTHKLNVDAGASTNVMNITNSSGFGIFTNESGCVIIKGRASSASVC